MKKRIISLVAVLTLVVGLVGVANSPIWSRDPQVSNGPIEPEMKNIANGPIEKPMGIDIANGPIESDLFD